MVLDVLSLWTLLDPIGTTVARAVGNTALPALRWHGTSSFLTNKFKNISLFTGSVLIWLPYLRMHPRKCTLTYRIN